MVHRSVFARAGAAALLLATLACKGGTPTAAAANGAAASGDDPVVATLNGHEIRKAELTEWIKNDLYKNEVGDKPAGEAYEVEINAIDSLVDDKLMADAAKAA